MAETYGEGGGRTLGLGSGPRKDAACVWGGALYVGGVAWYYGAEPRACWEGFSGSEAELS